jgi:hypothetical protein
MHLPAILSQAVLGRHLGAVVVVGILTSLINSLALWEGEAVEVLLHLRRISGVQILKLALE